MRPGCKRSVVWEHFEKRTAENMVICRICKKEFRRFGNTSNLMSHLKKIHPTALRIVTPEEEEQHIDCPSTSSYEATSAAINVESAAEPPAKRQKQLRLYFSRGNEISDAERKIIDKKLIEMIVKDLQPLSIVENEGFLNYSKSLHPLYKLPNRKTVTSKLLPELYHATKTKIEGMLLHASHVAITTDIWTSESTKGYLSVTAHFAKDEHLHSAVLQTVELENRHTGENIASHLKKVFQNWNIENKITCIVTDNASNIKNAVVEHLKKKHRPCVAHTLNLVVNDTIDGNADLSKVLKKCRGIVAHFKSSVQSSEKLRKMQKQMNLRELKVKQDVSTRWNSTLLMLERLLLLKDPLSAVMSSLPSAPEFLDANEWGIISDCIPLLKPIESMTIILSAEKYPTMSLVIPLVRGLQHGINSHIAITNVAFELQKTLLEAISRRLGALETNVIASRSTFLDPRLKKTAFGNDLNSAHTQALITHQLEEMMKPRLQAARNIRSEPQASASTASTSSSTASSKFSIWEHFDNKLANVSKEVSAIASAELMIKQYLGMPHVERSSNPLKFWEEQKNAMPELYQLQSRYLSIPATTVPSERVFSKAGQIINDRRNKLLSKNLDYIIFLNGNIDI